MRQWYLRDVTTLVTWLAALLDQVPTMSTAVFSCEALRRGAVLTSALRSMRRGAQAQMLQRNEVARRQEGFTV